MSWEREDDEVPIEFDSSFRCLNVESLYISISGVANWIFKGVLDVRDDEIDWIYDCFINLIDCWEVDLAVNWVLEALFNPSEFFIWKFELVDAIEFLLWNGFIVENVDDFQFFDFDGNDDW